MHNLCRDAPRALMRWYGEIPEARNLDLLADLDRLGHYVLEVLLCLALGPPGLLGDPLLLHGRFFHWSS